MRTVRLLSPLILSLLCVMSAAAQKAPATQPSLQAEIETIYTHADGTETRAKGRFFRNRHGQIREDSGLGAIITDLKKGTVTILVAERKEARVMQIPSSQRTPASANRPQHEVFEETIIDGRRISKARIRGPQGQEVEFWTANDLGIVTKTKSYAGGMTMVRELKNLSTDEPDMKLFTIPADYKLMERQLPDERPALNQPAKPTPVSGRGKGRGGQ